MVRDLMIDIPEHDLLFDDKSSSSEPVFDVVWGDLFDDDKQVDTLICNVIIPEAYWESVKYDDNLIFVFKFKTAYKPIVKHFSIRPVGLKDKIYSRFTNIRGQYGIPVKSYVLSKNIAAPIYACQLPFIDIDGDFVIKMVQNEKSELLDTAYIYSSKSNDIEINYSDDQSAQLLSLCAPGKSYRYPTTGVGIYNYLNTVVGYTDMQKMLVQQFSGDNKPIVSADFDSTTGALNTVYVPEKEEEDTGLLSIDQLDKAFFDKFTDEEVRKDTVLDELKDIDFNKLLDGYSKILSLIMFVDESSELVRIVNDVREGMFDSDGNIVESNDYYIVTATLESDTIIMFDDEQEDNIKDTPVFIVNDSEDEGKRLYTALVEQPYWLTETCHKCMILQKRATIRYMIRQDRFRDNKKGLFVVAQTSANIKNMCAVVQDERTGQLLGIVSDKTNISDISMNEIVQYIYASKNN